MSQVVTHESWFTRLGGSIKGVLCGFVLFAVSFPILFMNEGRAVKTAKALEEGESAVVEASIEAVDSANEGKFVHLVGRATTDAVLEDDLFGVSVNSIRLTRHVETLQWQEKQERETRKKLGGGTETVTTYSYVQEWFPKLINSSRFHEATTHQNPTDIPFQQLTKETSDVFVGAHRLPKSLIQQITTTEPIEVELEHVQKEWAEGLRSYTDADSNLNGFYWSRSSDTDSKIGDVRILFAATRPTEVSIMAQQTRDTFTPFIAKNGRQLNMLTIGTATSEQMIATAAAENSMWTWILRAVGTIMMFAGITLVARPLSVLADVFPPVGTVVEMGTGLVAVLVAGAFSLATISFAWLFYRPLIGVPMLLAGIGLIAFLVTKLVPRSEPAKTEEQLFVDRPFGSEGTQQPSNNSLGV
ncbi:MAG: TMEM43 family protein [Planctomycetes bacterium]|nr:TMEM43 family protein [Planctomycetota bacterium]